MKFLKIFFISFILFFVSLSSSYAQTVALVGDANRDGHVDGLDFMAWLLHYGESVSDILNGDFSLDGRVDGVDYTLWLSNYGKTATVTPTLNVPSPATSSVGQQKGIWISSEEIAKLPTSGAAWDK